MSFSSHRDYNSDLEEICKSVEAVMKAQNRWRYVVPEKYGSQLDALDSKMKHCLEKYQVCECESFGFCVVLKGSHVDIRSHSHCIQC